MYAVKEIYKTIQGEGTFSGRPAVFCRFTGCNLWSGLEKDRLNAICQFCDTNFVGTNGRNGGKYDAAGLADQIQSVWSKNNSITENKFVVFTGGEPLLQLDSTLINTLKESGFYVAVETNGTKHAPEEIDWICVSPKANTEIKLRSGNELKLVYPQTELHPRQVDDLDFERFFLQPMDGPDVKRNTELAIEYCLTHPRWELSIQMHRLLGIA